MPLTSGKRAFLDVLKQEGVEYLFGNPGTTELPLMDGLVEEPALTYVLALQEAGGRGDGRRVRPGLGQARRHQRPRGSGARERARDALRRPEGGGAAPGDRGPARSELQRHRAHPLGGPSSDRAPLREVVGGGAAARGSAAARPPRGEDRAGAPDRPGLPVAAGGRPPGRRRHRAGRADARGAADPRRPRRGGGGRRACWRGRSAR